MKDDVLAWLHDMQAAARAIKTFAAGKKLKDYARDEMLRSAVERKFEIIGEALNRIHRISPATCEHIRHQRDIVSFRNILVHGYAAIDDTIVWSIVHDEIDDLVQDIDALLCRRTTGRRRLVSNASPAARKRVGKKKG